MLSMSRIGVCLGSRRFGEEDFVMRAIISNRAAAGVLTGVVATLCVVATGTPAAARTLHHHRYHPNTYVYQSDQPPITVNRRSWLDPGPVVPVGSENAYVVESTGLNQTPDEAYFPSRFEEDNLPRPFYPTGQPVPVVDFWTPAYPYP